MDPKIQLFRDLSKIWWDRYRILPRWRFLAKRKAKAHAYYWGEATKRAHASKHP